ncbi:hydroxymethylbilane synthase [Helicobacter sp. NHP22-001]|uniref:hydroxymethylbilane synthase n=1 Tax=Helicobacter sp. NHP22-001 TaxID=3040202 RepID=UPI00244D8FF8|nr:hydroxymethylbilane synthase [Helicobacter sp. NHP22-001]GMB96131.1 Porphobilinogen deaminase HemC [Helicobacter sp. NHP22-001]
MKELVIGSRGSQLALWQARHIQTQLENLGLKSRIEVVKTKGDKILDVPLAKIGGKGLFTKELEELLLVGALDLAVHSLKDVPVDLIPPLSLACVSKRVDSRDCFLSMHYPSLEDLPLGAKVGTTSLRRCMQLKRLRPDLDTLSLRGNIQTRLQRLQEGAFDAIILAYAGVERLQIRMPYCVPLSFKQMLPCMGQGALGVEMCSDHPLFATITQLNDPKSALLCGLERAFIARLNGGCQMPLGVHASLKGEVLEMRAIVGLLDASQVVEERIVGSIHEVDELLQLLLERFIEKGALDILTRISL